MAERQIVQIPPEQVKKLLEIDKIRADLAGYPISKKVHILLQEKLAQVFQSTSWFPHKDGVEKGRWFEYIRESIPVHIAAPIAIGAVRDAEEIIGIGFTKMLATNEGNKTWWGNYKQDVYDIGDYLIPRLQKKNEAAKYYENYKRRYLETLKLCEEMKKKDLSKLEKHELYERYERFYEKLRKYVGLSMDIDAMDPALENRMKEKLRSLMAKKEGSLIDERKFSSVYNMLTTPVELSYLNKEQLRLYMLAKDIKEKKQLYELFSYDDVTMIVLKIWQDHPGIKEEITSILGEYWWTSIGWTSGQEKDVHMYIMDLKKIFKDNPDIDGEIERLNAFRKKAAFERKRITSEYEFDEDMKGLMDIFDHYVEIHDWRKEIQMKGLVVAMNSILLEVSRRYGAKFDDLLWCWPWEILELIKSGKLDWTGILPRKEAFFFLVTKQDIEQHTGEMAIRRRKEEFSADVMNVQNFNGVIASLGKSIGKAKVCYSSSEAIKKIEQGDILVCSMTMPDYLPAMKKAGAIVTDEGGVTSHAAIVSRELKVPCIVGTKVATRVLNDNDRIEVNANHGVVKILERAK